ncbi:hypothetical protein M231_01739 [Tremella mesenterica]|uniref:Spindle assembly checkpoint component MAD1 n=1 Tax=Tremella mesenterica TaxID=5217 RepID=A0A4Q1BS97_TREME|nr:hypothetical protein M231_01739 [Tremella mesenterica]
MEGDKLPSSLIGSSGRVSIGGHSRSRSSVGSMFTPVQRDKLLGKRGAGDAGLEDPNTIRKQLAQSQSHQTTLKRDILTLEAREREQARKIEEQRVMIDKLKRERMILLEGETEERQTGESREKEWSEERLTMAGQMKILREKNAELAESLERLRSEHNHLCNKHSTLDMQYRSQSTLYESKLKDLQVECDSLRQWERRAKGLSIDLEEEKRRSEQRMQRTEDAASDRQVDEKVRLELKRQSQHLITLEKKNVEMAIELNELRQKRKEVDASERASREVERALREEIRTLSEQLERARRDMESLTQTYSDPSGPTGDIATLQGRLATLSNLHSQATAELAGKDKQIHSLQSRLSELSQSSTASIVELKKQLDSAERELRWAKEGRAQAERREELARKEAVALSRRATGGDIPSPGDQTAKVKQLEQLVEMYKAELESISRDSREVEERLAQGAGLVKQSALQAAEARVEQLEKDIESLEHTISQLTSANTTLDAEVNDLMRRVASGEYNPAKERCIELKDNPASRQMAIRTQMLEDLRQENQTLLAQLSTMKGPAMEIKEKEKVDGNASGMVPRASYDRLVKEKEELEKAHAKRLLRLKEIFGSKSKEFLEAVYSLLGWRIKFDESGADIRLSSMYAPKGKMGLTLRFASHEGHFGTMQMTGGMAKGLEDVRHFWIVERQSVPGFLAQVTTEMFEKTTIGRAAGYVGLE